MKYFMMILAFVILFSFNGIKVNADDGIVATNGAVVTGDDSVVGYFVCPSCQKLGVVKRIKRMDEVFGMEVTDSVLYCSDCGYNTERDSRGNIKLHVQNLWEYRYAANVTGCGCKTKTVPSIK